MAESHTQGATTQSLTNQPRKDDAGSQAIERRRPSETRRSDWASSPFTFMRRFMNDVDRMFEDFGIGPSLSPRYGDSTAGRGALWAPQIDLFERDGKLVVHADLPGLKQDDIRVQVDDGVLTISGERKHLHEHEKGGVYQCERSYGAFQRSIGLPEGVAPESVQASFENGVLEVSMPMPTQSASKGRTVPIQSKPAGVTH